MSDEMRSRRARISIQVGIHPAYETERKRTMPRRSSNRPTKEVRIHLSTDDRLPSPKSNPAELAGGTQIPGDFTDSRSTHWEQAWIDLGGEG
jgi:hypothetical protein